MNSKRKDDPKAADLCKDNDNTLYAECQNIIEVKRPKITIHKGRNSSVIRIDNEAADILEDFANKSMLPISKLASNFIKFAADHTIITEVEDV